MFRMNNINEGKLMMVFTAIFFIMGGLGWFAITLYEANTTHTLAQFDIQNLIVLESFAMTVLYVPYLFMKASRRYN